jgi:hypothetical protein
MFDTETRRHRGRASSLVFIKLCLCVSVSLCWTGLSFSGHAKDDVVAIDFSHAGYGGGGVSVPSVGSVLRVRPTGGDDTALIQAALDRAASMPADGRGLRGAVLLERGRFRVGGVLRLSASGVVLRGAGVNETTVVATGRGRRALVEVGGDEPPTAGASVKVVDEKVPAGGLALTLESVEGLAPGDRVVVRRPSTKEWIEALGMNKAEGAFADQRLHWTPGSRDLLWDRVIASVDVDAKRVTLDAPITTALESRYGGGALSEVVGNVPVRNVGVEALRLESEFDEANEFDEEHAWIGVRVDNVEDAWVRAVTAYHFAGSAVRVGRRARRVSVERCNYASPVSEVGGYRRQGFFVEGQQVLVRDCRSEGGTNDFAVGLTAAGPVVFLDCHSTDSRGASGSFESWASGVLYERVRIGGAALLLTQDSARSQGGGWTAANSVVWNCEADKIEARGPEGAPNVVKRSAEPLYETQLAKRLPGRKPDVGGGRPDTRRVPLFKDRRPPSRPGFRQRQQPLDIVNGRFVINGRALWGGMLNGAWWKGQVSPETARASGGVSVTRFVPGRVGPGLTEDLGKLAERMVEEGTPFFNGGHGLWYERRRDAHTITAQPDANVWAPFYEMPWARSGKGKAWDGLSKFDLTRFNPWYFERTREFAEECERRGLVYYHSLYNTHNLLETAAHWVDFPWRPANNVNDTGLPEPPPLDERKAVHLANQFYDANDPRLRALHRAFILHTLDVLGERPNVVLTLGFQFAGPLAFQQFFLDTVAEWQRVKRRRVRVALITSKDITDAVLADPVRSKLVSVIDTRYWQYRPDGKLWAPPGGRNLAFREMITAEFKRSGDAPPDTTPAQVYRQVREYRDRFPDRAVVAWHSGAGPIPILMAGGAQALMRNPAAGQSQGAQSDRTKLDPFVRERLSPSLPRMSPLDGVLEDAANNWCLSDPPSETVLIYSLNGPSVTLARALPRTVYTGLWFDPRTGETRPLDAPPSWGKGTTINKPTGEDWLLLLTKK